MKHLLLLGIFLTGAGFAMEPEAEDYTFPPGVLETEIQSLVERLVRDGEEPPEYEMQVHLKLRGTPRMHREIQETWNAMAHPDALPPAAMDGETWVLLAYTYPDFIKTDVPCAKENFQYDVESLVASETWMDNGGDGWILSAGTCFVVFQTVDVHAKIREFLDRLNHPDLPETEADQALLRKLAQPVSVQYPKEVTLRRVVDDLQRQFGLVFENNEMFRWYVDNPDITFPDGIVWKSRPLRKLLDHLFRYYETNISWDLHGGRIHLLEREWKDLIFRTYALPSWILAFDSPERRAHETEELIAAILHAVSPDSWVDLGGWGAIRPIGKLLGVTQSPKNQRAVRAFLEKCQHPEIVTPQADATQKLLERRVSVNYVNASLADVEKDFQERLQLPLQWDTDAIAEDGLEETTFLLKAEKVPVRVVLDLLCEGRFDWQIQDGRFWLTSMNGEAIYETRVYLMPPDIPLEKTEINFKDGLRGGSLMGGGYMQYMPLPPSKNWVSGIQVEQFLEALKNNVYPDTFEENGGEGFAGTLHDFLIVKQTCRGHWLVREFLRQWNGVPCEIDSQTLALAEKNVTLDYQNLPPAKLLDDLKRQTGAEIVFTTSLWDEGFFLPEKITYSCKDKRVSEVLNEIFDLSSWQSEAIPYHGCFLLTCNPEDYGLVRVFKIPEGINSDILEEKMIPIVDPDDVETEWQVSVCMEPPRVVAFQNPATILRIEKFLQTTFQNGIPEDYQVREISESPIRSNPIVREPGVGEF
ncbi:MAG: hypothetical protein Q4D98_09505 [Planctomycetia bacterium]|nr:hypothetical protein [Planctomycetia bacterium]